MIGSVHDYQQPVNAERSIDSFAQETIDQVQLGAWSTDVKAGIVDEIGCHGPGPMWRTAS